MKLQHACSNVTPVGHIILISTQPVFALTPELCMLCGMQTIPILVFILIRQWLELTIYPTRGKDANHYSTDVVKLSKLK